MLTSLVVECVDVVRPVGLAGGTRFSVLAVVVSDEDDEALLCGTVEYVFVETTVVALMVTVTTEMRAPWDVRTSDNRNGRIRYSHPPGTQLYPEIQHPPPSASEQVVHGLGHLPTTFEHFFPFGQHPTSPDPVSFTISQVSPILQHRSVRPIDVQAFVPVGHLKSRA